MDWLAQALGILASALAIFGAWQKAEKRFLTVFLVTHATWAVHFGLIGAWTGAGVNLVSSFRALAIQHMKGSSWVCVGFAAFYGGLGVMTWDGWIEFLPALAAMNGTVCLFLLPNRWMRVGLVASSLMWLTHNLVVGSVGGAIIEMVMATMHTVTSWRIWRDRARTNVASAPLT